VLSGDLEAEGHDEQGARAASVVLREALSRPRHASQVSAANRLGGVFALAARRAKGPRHDPLNALSATRPAGMG
jgi:hypothetical protein